jgi:hypothetical protein
MGHLFWPSRLLGYRSLLLCLSILSCSVKAQLVPDDIAFKPAETAQADSTPELPQTETPIQNDITSTTSVEANPIVDQPKTHCKATRQWQKSLVIMAMPRLNPSSSNAGNLYQVETRIPNMLAEALAKSPSIKSQLNPLSSRHDVTDDKRRQQTRDIAAKAESQFVLSGEILDMSMRDTATAYSPSLLQNLRNHFTDITMMNFADNRDRHFSLRLELRDGFTGDLLLEKYFQTSGIWKETDAIGFDSPALWKSNYGRKIKQLVSRASRELINNLECQPFMARIDLRPGQTDMMLQAGANNGLNAGDRLNLYQMVVVASENYYDTYQTRLIKRNLHLQLKEVYPSHSLASLVENDLLNGQYLAVGEE